MRIPCHCGRHSSLLPCLASHSANGSIEETAGRGRRLECREECFALLEAQEKEEEKSSLEKLRAAQNLPVTQQGKKKNNVISSLSNTSTLSKTFSPFPKFNF